MARRDTLTPAEARRAVLAAQGFGGRPVGADSRALLSRARKLGVMQIDSVNVLARAHYLPLFSRLGAYDRTALDAMSARRPRRLFEYWAHEASLLPVETQPLLRWRMAEQHAWGNVADSAGQHPELVDQVLACVTTIGPATAAEVELALEHGAPRPTDHWGWNWSLVKRILEHLFWAGEVASAGRDAQFRRLYATPSTVLPRAVLAAPTPERPDAIRQLVGIAARALGVATATDLRDYFRLPSADTTRALDELTAAGDVSPVTVDGWPPAWRHRSTVVPRDMSHNALLVPFDPLIWDRTRVERLFGMRYRIEIYVPAAKREFGYYVLPFLQDDRLAARVDLKADRAAGTLRVLGAWGHEADPATAERLAVSLGELAHWLDVPNLTVAAEGDLARAVAAAARVSVG